MVGREKNFDMCKFVEFQCSFIKGRYNWVIISRLFSTGSIFRMQTICRTCESVCWGVICQ